MLGPWRLLRQVGQGRWTRVFLANPADGPSNRPADYAIKLVFPEHRRDDLAVQLLRREACVAREVAHPHLVSVLSSHLQGAPHYLVTPYLSGATLQAMLEADHLPPPAHALWIVRQAAQALRELHEAGWLHGDVKPSNLMAAPSGHATLIDLGLARRLFSSETGPQGPCMGSPSYTAPETFTNSRSVDAFSDIYSLGVTLYQLLAGRLPFESRDRAELAAAHRRQPPPELRITAPHVPTCLAKLVRRMLSKEPLRRPSTSELVSRLVELEIDTFAERTPARAGMAAGA